MLGFIILLFIWGIYYFVIKGDSPKHESINLPIQYAKLVEFLTNDSQAKVISKNKDYVFIDAKLGSTPVEFNLHLNDNILNVELILKQNGDYIKTWKFKHNNQCKMIEQINSDMLELLISHFTKTNKMINEGEY